MSGEHLRELALHRLGQIESLQAENKELKELFDLQHKRSLEADQLWQESTGETCMPDLGKLLDWFMKKQKQLQAENAKLKEEVEMYKKREVRGAGKFLNQSLFIDRQNELIAEMVEGLNKIINHPITEGNINLKAVIVGDSLIAENLLIKAKALTKNGGKV